jgi:hypothetical protein
MISIRQKGDYSKVTGYFERVLETIKLGRLDKYGRLGVEALSSATPVDTGKTADSWTYEIKHGKESASIVFKNTNVVNGVPIAIILQYGHATNGGGYVAGYDYINPALRPVFEKLSKEAWAEVTKV